MSDELGLLGCPLTTETAFPLYLQCRNGSGTATAPDSTPAFAIYAPDGTSVKTGSLGASDHDSKTGLRRATTDLTSWSAVSANTDYTVVFTYAISSAAKTAKGVIQTR